jgi:hypothetical protein
MVCPIQKKPNDGSRQEAQFDSAESEDEGGIDARRMRGPLAVIEVGSLVMAPVGRTKAIARVKTIDDGYYLVEFEDADQTLVDHARNEFLVAELELIVVGTLSVPKRVIRPKFKAIIMNSQSIALSSQGAPPSETSGRLRTSGS